MYLFQYLSPDIFKNFTALRYIYVIEHIEMNSRLRMTIS